MSSEVKIIQGRGIPLVGNDIDTDRIIPARFLRCVTFDGLGEEVFKDDRAQSNGTHPFDQPQYQGAKLLVVNANFGCGSSREHAPQAIARWGINGIIGESFAEIFFGNCVAMGVACVTADPATVRKLQEAIADNPNLEITLDVEGRQVQFPGFSASVNMAAGPHQMLTTGTWDTCGQLVGNRDAIRTTAAQLPYLAWK